MVWLYQDIALGSWPLYSAAPLRLWAHWVLLLLSPLACLPALFSSCGFILDLFKCFIIMSVYHNFFMFTCKLSTRNLCMYVLIYFQWWVCVCVGVGLWGWACPKWPTWTLSQRSWCPTPKKLKHPPRHCRKSIKKQVKHTIRHVFQTSYFGRISPESNCVFKMRRRMKRCLPPNQ